MPFSGGTKTGQQYLRQQYLPKLLGSRIRVVELIKLRALRQSAEKAFRVLANPSRHDASHHDHGRHHQIIVNVSIALISSSSMITISMSSCKPSFVCFPRPSLALCDPSLLKAQGNATIPVSFNSGQRARAVRSQAAPSAPAESSPKHLGRESHICAEESRASDTCISDNFSGHWFLVKRLGACHLKVSHRSHIPTTTSTRESTNAPKGALAKAPVEAHIRELLPRGALELLPRGCRDLVAFAQSQILATQSGCSPGSTSQSTLS